MPRPVARGVAVVPGAAFFAEAPRAETLRLSFFTVSAARNEQGVAALAQALAELPRDAADHRPLARSPAPRHPAGRTPT